MKGAPRGWAPALLANSRLGWKGSRGLNICLFVSDEEKNAMTLPTAVNAVNCYYSPLTISWSVCTWQVFQTKHQPDTCEEGCSLPEKRRERSRPYSQMQGWWEENLSETNGPAYFWCIYDKEKSFNIEARDLCYKTLRRRHL